MEVKAVFFDIDGTLVNDRKSVLKSTKEAIKIVKDQGVLVGVATGRGPFFVKDLMDDLDLDFAVTYNGQYIFNKERVLFASPIDKRSLRQVIAYAKENRKEIAMGTRQDVIGSRIMSFGLSPLSQLVSRFVPKFLTRTVSHSFNRMVSKALPQKEDDLLDLINQPIYQVLMLMTPEESNQAASEFEYLKFTRSNPFAADIINQGNSKLEGIRRVGKEYGFDLNQVMAFGDSDNDLEMLAGVGMSVAMGNGSSSVKEVAKHITTSNQEDGIHKALEHFGVLASEKVFVSRDYHFNKVKAFHHMMDERTQEEPKAWDLEGATHRADFKIEELVEFVRASSNSDEDFQAAVAELHQALDKAATKVSKNIPAKQDLIGQVDALIDTLYFTYGSFVLMGVDPERIFEIVHQANMGKVFPDGKAHFDPVTHKILKPDDWEEKYAPEPAIKKEIERQIKAYERHKERENK
ncbi:alanine aminotransferase [Streptococcus sp. HMSC067H01]|uniref:Cof-type HAD-IIB family hydrolase n=1 Tax=Streptococcus sp. HMSC067H01 TaxID=1739491 RepID=UPI0008B4B0BF|nr:Cof-type HAD-IIB family hydrolase [Streptococcus sp. HMSC067H01]OFP46051.1 alanine aminotransferase [Streptococcus sp. HMSC067H01]